ncbi:MAG: redoxin domain-containing protein [Candidatus Eisenbacteria bacterium]|nr:redoxin domain-containing protein [Candidatus Eisenbacteria bacterium]
MKTDPTHTACFGIAVLAAALIMGAGAAAAVEVGDSAPDFFVTDLDGRSYSLSSLEDTVILLFFYSPGDPYCVTVAPQLESAIWQSFSWHNFQLLGINVGTQERSDVIDFRDATNVTFPLIVEGADVGGSYAMGSNSFVLIDSREEVAYVAAGGGNVYNESELQDAVSSALEGVAPPKEATWGRIKRLFDMKSRSAVQPH